jgi:hypothetical protein
MTQAQKDEITIALLKRRGFIAGAKWWRDSSEPKPSDREVEQQARLYFPLPSITTPNVSVYGGLRWRVDDDGRLEVQEGSIWKPSDVRVSTVPVTATLVRVLAALLDNPTSTRPMTEDEARDLVGEIDR